MSLSNRGGQARARRALSICRRQLLRSEHLRRELQGQLIAQQRRMAVVAHDLRAPLHTVNVALTLIAGEATAGMQRPLRVAQASLLRAGTLLHDLLELAVQAQSERVPLNRKRHRLDELVLRALEDMRLRFPDRAFDYQSPPGGAWIEADADRVAQIVDNLISNALLHGSPRAPVAIRVDGEGAQVGLHVHNRGSLAEEARARLFQPMSHGKGRASRGSMGLGLYIVKQLAEAHGGRVEVSADAESTMFSVFLPHARPG